MTVESLSAHIRPPELSELKMFDCGEDNNIRKDSSLHDYARPSSAIINNGMKNNGKMMPNEKSSNNHQFALALQIPDHSLATEASTSVCSPNNSLMYEIDPMDCTKALMSPCASEALPSPMSSCSWRKDSCEQLSHAEEEESIDLTACMNNPFWGQMDGTPLQDYLPDISSHDITEWNELAALADSPPTLGSKTSCDLSITQPQLHRGLMKESSRGPTLAELNDKDCVLDHSPSTGLVAQSWNSLTTISLSQPESNTSTNGLTAWNTSYNAATLSPSVANTKPSASLVTPRACTTVVSSEVTRPVQPDPQVDGKMTKLASLLAIGVSAEAVPLVSAPVAKDRQDLFYKSSSTELLAEATHTASLQDLLCATSEVVPATVPKAVTPPVSQKAAATGGKWKSQNSTGNTSMERKWEEIRDYIDSNRKHDEAILAAASAEQKPVVNNNQPVKRKSDWAPLEKETPVKKIKAELPDILETNNMDEDDDDSDYGNSDDDFSDIDSDCSYSSFIEDLCSGNKKDKRYFWQYNTQSKGPKGKRLCKSMQERDPHCLADFEDPVFQPDCQDARYKHNGKARKGDGNDITPSPLKLFQIGNELLKLNKKINSIGVNIPVKTKDGVKSKSRREKNKFASRACRLKKKAQHEANKLKLFGLEEEHRQLMDILRAIKKEIYQRVKTGKIKEGERFVQLYENILKKHPTVTVAGNTADYVNTVLKRVASGDKTGGINLDRQ